MAELLTCPIDETPLVMASDNGVFETACHKCRRAYRITRGVVQSCELKSAKEPGHKRIAIRIRADDETVSVEDVVFEARFRHVNRNAVATAIEQVGPGDATRLVQVQSRDDAAFNPREPGDQALIRTAGLVIQGGLVATFATVLTVYFYHWAFLALAPFAALAILAAAGWRYKSTSTRRRLDKIQWSHLEREQWLLTQLQRYRLRSAEIEKRTKRSAKQLQEMEGLASDMESASGDYAHRLEIVRRGIEALRTHRESDVRLRQAIESTMEMVEIEYRAARALQYLPDDAIGRLTDTIAELESIQAENMMLESRLEANAEVEALAPA